MKQKITGATLSLLFMSMVFIACKNEGEKKETTNTGDTTTGTADIPGFNAKMDATTTSGYPARVLADSLNLKAYEFVANPGDSIPLHAHPDHIIYVLEGGTAEIKSEGKEAQVVEFPKGACLILGPDAHSAKNTGTSALKLLIVHIYRPRS